MRRMHARNGRATSACIPTQSQCQRQTNDERTTNQGRQGCGEETNQRTHCRQHARRRHQSTRAKLSQHARSFVVRSFLPSFIVRTPRCQGANAWIGRKAHRAADCRTLNERTNERTNERSPYRRRRRRRSFVVRSSFVRSFVHRQHAVNNER